MTIITRKLTLVGAYRGQTINLKVGDKVYEFQDGSMEVMGPSGDVDNLAKYLQRCYQAFPDPSKELDAAVEAIHGGGDAAETDTNETGPGDEYPGGADDAAGGAGEQTPEPGEATEGAGHAEPKPGTAEPGRSDQGHGQSPIAAALSKLDPSDDEHWTADGKPKMLALEAFFGRSDITRAQVEQAAPGYTRETARATTNLRRRT